MALPSLASARYEWRLVRRFRHSQKPEDRANDSDAVKSEMKAHDIHGGR